MLEVEVTPDFESWRNAARGLLADGIEPHRVTWKSSLDQDESLPGLFDSLNTASTAVALRAAPSATKASAAPRGGLRVPADFIARAPVVHAFRDPSTPALLYRILWRLTHGEPDLLKIFVDDDVQEFESRARLVRRDIHKMHAFVRFREVDDTYVAWHRPDHRIVRLATPFFAKRFNGMKWSILTDDECAHWDGETLSFSEGLPASAAPREDASEDLWKAYYRSTFNPARIKWNAMVKELPVRHWKTLPETAVIQDLLRDAPGRLQRFASAAPASAADWFPSREEGEITLDRLRAAIPQCRACGICERTTGPVFGVGPRDARVVFVGEQPGDTEDLEGRPFVGPAGQLFDEALADIGFDRTQAYVTNAVKAFKFIPRGKMRLHQGASPREITACNPWLRAELQLIRPEIVVCLGRSAAQAMLGKSVKMADVRGKWFETPLCPNVFVVPHPSFILRVQDRDQQAQEYVRFREELSQILPRLISSESASRGSRDFARSGS